MATEKTTNTKPQRVFLSAQRQHPISQYATYAPSIENIAKGHRATVIDLDLKTGQFTLRQNAPHYEEQLQALKRLVEIGRLVEVPTGKETDARFMFNGTPDTGRTESEAILAVKRELAETSDQFKSAADEKDRYIAELEAKLNKK